MFYLQQALQNGTETLDTLKSRYAISSKRHPEFPELVHFSYSTLFSPKRENIVRDSRGAILNESDSWNFVCNPYFKFFNYGEEAADVIDWTNARVLEKEDGTLVNMWYYGNKWNISTNGSPDASGALSGITPATFNELFWQVWNQLGYRLPSVNSNEYTFMFELMTPLNQIVVNQVENRIVSHGVKHKSGKETSTIDFRYYFSMEYGWEVVDDWPLHSAEEVIEWAAKLDGRKSEGYVVVDNSGSNPDGSFSRLKFKSPDYCALHYSRKNGVVTRKDIMKVILDGEGSEFLVYNPTYKIAFDELSTKFRDIVSKSEVEYDYLIAHAVEHIDFVRMTQRSFVPSKILFDMKRGAIETIEEGFVNMGAAKALVYLDSIEN